MSEPVDESFLKLERAWRINPPAYRSDLSPVEDDVAALARRVAELERTVRYLDRIVVAALVLAVLVWIF